MVQRLVLILLAHIHLIYFRFVICIVKQICWFVDLANVHCMINCDYSVVTVCAFMGLLCGPNILLLLPC